MEFGCKFGVGSGNGTVFASQDDLHGERTTDVRRQAVALVCDRRASIPASGLVVASETASPDCRYGYVRVWGVLIRSARCLPSNSSGRRWSRWFHPCFFDEKTAQSKTCNNPLGGGADSASIVTISRVRRRTFLDLARLAPRRAVYGRSVGTGNPPLRGFATSVGMTMAWDERAWL